MHRVSVGQQKLPTPQEALSTESEHTFWRGKSDGRLGCPPNAVYGGVLYAVVWLVRIRMKSRGV